MEPPAGFLATLWNFLCFLPYFVGLLILGTIKGIILFPIICLIVGIGNTAIILGLWPVHFVWTYFCIMSAKQFGPVLKIVVCVTVLPLQLILWPVVGIVGSVLGGAAYGLLSPVFETFNAVGEGKTNKFYHCFYDGTVSTVKGSFTIVRDFMDVCYHTYFSVMDDLKTQGPPDVKYYEIKLLHLPGAVVVGVIGFMVDMPLISFIAMYKSIYMLFKGWHRLFHDLIGREGPFLETICVPFAGLAILLWPLAVVGGVMASMVASIFYGAYAGVVVYQESSLWMGFRYIVASLAIYDEYSNDILDMPEGSCFPKLTYRKKQTELPRTTSRAPSFSKHRSLKHTPSFTSPMIELKPLEMMDSLFKEYKRYGEILFSQGTITAQDLADAKSSEGSRVISIGLPACCILQTLLRSAKANSPGILLIDNSAEITTSNRPKDTIYDWFLSPLLIIKDQIKAENLTESEELYLGKLVLLSGDPVRLKNTNIGSPPESERKQAELDALARRLQGITKSISRYPTYRRKFDELVKALSDELGQTNDGSSSSKPTTSAPNTISRSKSAFAGFARLFSQKSFTFTNKTSVHGGDPESQQQPVDRDVTIS